MVRTRITLKCLKKRVAEKKANHNFYGSSGSSDIFGRYSKRPSHPVNLSIEKGIFGDQNMFANAASELKDPNTGTWLRDDAERVGYVMNAHGNFLLSSDPKSFQATELLSAAFNNAKEALDDNDDGAEGGFNENSLPFLWGPPTCPDKWFKAAGFANDLAVSYAHRGMLEESEKALRQSQYFGKRSFFRDQEIITDSNLSHVLCLQGRFGTALGLAQGAFNDASSRFKVDLLQAASGAVLSNILRHEKLFEKSLEVSTRVTEHSKRMLNAKNSEIRKSGYVSSFPVSSYMVASLINRVLVLVERADSVEDIKNAHDLVLDAMSVVSSTSYAFDDRTPLQLLFAVTCPEKNSTIATFSKILEADQFMEGIVRRLIEQNMDNLLSIAVEPAVIPTSNEIHSNQLVGLSIDSKPIWIQAQVPMLHGHVLSTYLNHAKRLM